MNIGESGVLMIDTIRQLKSYVESENREYSISFAHEDAKELLKYIYRLEVQNFKLDKALDKACDELESYDYQANLKLYQYDADNYNTSKEWKAWCLDE